MTAPGRTAAAADTLKGAPTFTIADPDDPGMLDVVGFDTAAPTVIADFSRGGIDGEEEL